MGHVETTIAEVTLIQELNNFSKLKYNKLHKNRIYEKMFYIFIFFYFIKIYQIIFKDKFHNLRSFVNGFSEPCLLYSKASHIEHSQTAKRPKFVALDFEISVTIRFS